MRAPRRSSAVLLVRSQVILVRLSHRWSPGQIERRYASTAPTSLNKDARTVDAVLSMGSPVQRFCGTEVLRIDPDAVDV